ncbi:trehalose-phosphatase [Rhodoferax sediminis]|uniref:trehalose-phosphatase n=1 Tax=Rhodoferax sediminis TaxID=2509614 RepID=UPI001FCEC7B8|nr:trehalose-phosphatase [Rhodoferax sediminis]
MLPPIGAQSALFLDFDGTLAELAPQPDAVQVAADLVPTLTQLAARLNGALAIVSGRPLTDLDGFLAPLRLPSVAEHGAQRRLISGEIIRMASPDLQAVICRVNTLAQRHPGLRVEIKTAAVALHYRHAPEMEAVCRQAMDEVVRSTVGLELLHGKYVHEIKPAGASKGTAIEDFMAQAPFAGRLPLFAGDDITDEDGFSAVQRMGGCGIKVGEGATRARYRCLSPVALRQWLQRAAQDLTGRTSP